MDQPTRRYPLVIIGTGVKRWERRKDDGGGEEYLEDKPLSLFEDRSLDNWGPSELQKKSTVSIMLTYPWCFKFSWYWKFQEPGVPGSELGVFFRIGLWRWDPNMNQYIGPRTLYFGLHDD